MTARLTPSPAALALALALAGWAALSASVAFAGPNARGTLILDDGPDLVGCEDLNSLCDYVAENDPLLDCASADPHFSTEYTFGMWTIYAAFPADASPRLKGLTFGLDYDPESVFFSAESCGDFELSDPTWPAPGSGNAITWNETQTSALVPVYAFAGYAYYSDTRFDLVPHPVQGAFFADDSIPSVLDPIAALGSLGFGNEPGYLPCPEGVPLGACCLPDGSCVLLSNIDCDSAGGVWHPEVLCDPNPCDPVPTVQSSWGGIKEQYRDPGP